MFDIFEAYYINRAIEMLGRVPKEVVAAAAVYAVAHEVIKAKTDVKVAELKFNTARLELEIEQLKKERLNPK